MSLTKKDLKILLLQIRDDDATKQEEYYAFVEFSGLQPEQITLLNVFDTPSFDKNIVDDYHALFVGGSSDASVLEPDTYPFVKDCQQLIRYCYEENIPTFASCFGFQLAALELGGKIILDKKKMEMGTYQIQLTEAAKEDPLFHDLPDGFHIISGHKERAASLGDDFITLAKTELCPYHSFKIKDKPFYGFQFHPEVNREVLLSRVARYQDRYLDDAESLQKIIEASIYETPESNSLVKRFVERILLNNNNY